MAKAPASSPHDATVQRAMQAHQGGRASEAERLYRHVLSRDARHPDALHLLGLLHAQRREFDRAADLIGRAAAVRPAEPMFHNNLGNVALEQGRFDDAEAHYRRALALQPERVDAINNLGVLLGRRGLGEEATQLLQRAIELAPEFHDARHNLAGHFLRLGRAEDALRVCVQGLVVTPRNPRLRRRLGMVYTMLGMRDQAIRLYQNWLELEPLHPEARHHLQALLGDQVPDRASDDYVTHVFDSFAESFDAKLASLDYRAPQHVADAVVRHAGAPARQFDLLDAGCGTGLCGPLLAPFARTLIGVDLSQGMLRRAAARGVYDELVESELVACLTQRPASHDVVVSADTLCYFGRLEGFAAAAAGSLRGNGLLVFTVEALQDEGAAPFLLQQHGRYSHRRTYVETVLQEAGFCSTEAQAVVLRQEAGLPVSGWLVCARRAS